MNRPVPGLLAGPREGRAARFTRLSAAALLFLLPGAGACGHTAPQGTASGPPQFLPVEARWCLGEAKAAASPTCLQLEVPRGDRQYAWGLQMRPRLPPLRGMWFVYEPPALARFWMHRTPEPLDLLFVRRGQVIAIQERAAPCMRLPCPSYGPGEPVDGVVELAAGEAARLGIEVGTPATIQPLSGAPPSGPARD